MADKHKIACAHGEIVEIDKLKPNPKNPNKHSADQIDRLAKIIDYQGQRSPIVVSKRTGEITKGHGRLEAMKFLGWTHVAVDIQDYENEAQEYADIVADNAIAIWAELDMESIQAETLNLGPDFDVDWLGVDDFFLPNVTNDGPEPKEKPEKKAVVCPECGHAFLAEKGVNKKKRNG